MDLLHVTTYVLIYRLPPSVLQACAGLPILRTQEQLISKVEFDRAKRSAKHANRDRLDRLDRPRNGSIGGNQCNFYLPLFCFLNFFKDLSIQANTIMFCLTFNIFGQRIALYCICRSQLYKLNF